MRYLKVREVIEACKARYIGEGNTDEVNRDFYDREVTGMVTDSRAVKPGYAFVAVKGERVDGHIFIGDVIKKGASLVICSEVPEEFSAPVQGDPDNALEGASDNSLQDNPVSNGALIPPIAVVDDPLEALRQTARLYRSSFDIPVVAVIGSVGKTSTKEYVASVLSQKYEVLKTEGNYNNDIGLPLTLMSVTPRHTMAVVEMGINHFGEMSLLASIARPDAVVFTNVAPCHLEFLGDLQGVLKAKSEVFEYMDKNSPVIINGDDELLTTLKAKLDMPVISCGFDGDCDVRPEDLEEFSRHVKLPGRHMVSNALLAYGAGIRFGLTREEILRGIEAVLPVEGRSHIITAGRLTIIDDCYNANPVSMKAAIDLLATYPGHRIAVLGDMGELGERSELYHREVGEYAASKGIELLFAAGPRAKEICRGYGDKEGKARHYEDVQALIRALTDYITGETGHGHNILLKASHSMHFNEVLQALLDLKLPPGLTI